MCLPHHSKQLAHHRFDILVHEVDRDLDLALLLDTAAQDPAVDHVDPEVVEALHLAGTAFGQHAVRQQFGQIVELHIA